MISIEPTKLNLKANKAIIFAFDSSDQILYDN